MGRGTVAGGGAAGLYSLALDVGKAERDAAVAKMDARLAELTPKIAELQAALEAAEAARDEARGLAQAAISAYADAMRADPEGDHQALADEVQARIEVAVQLEGEAAKVRIPLEEAQAEKAQLEKDRLAQLAVPVERTVSAWCVDLTENASGQVATLEVPGEPARVLIAPGGRAPAEADGRLLARGVMSPAQAFWNAAVLPGWQKWMPDYRTGTLTALDQGANRATVALDDLTSSAQGLRVNQADVLTDVPVVYMTCNAQAFEVGDRVVVAFGGRDWTEPTVVGFVSNPKPCGGGFYGLAVPGDLAVGRWFEQGGTWRWTTQGAYRAGNATHTNEHGDLVSWWGLAGVANGDYRCGRPWGAVDRLSDGRYAYYNGRAFDVGSGYYVRGACLVRHEGRRLLLAVAFKVAANPNDGSPSLVRVARFEVATGAMTVIFEGLTEAGEWASVNGSPVYDTPTPMIPGAPVYFSRTGRKAVGLTTVKELGEDYQAVERYEISPNFDAVSRTVGEKLPRRIVAGYSTTAFPLVYDTEGPLMYLACHLDDDDAEVLSYLWVKRVWTTFRVGTSSGYDTLSYELRLHRGDEVLLSGTAECAMSFVQTGFQTYTVSQTHSCTSWFGGGTPDNTASGTPGPGPGLLAIGLCLYDPLTGHYVARTFDGSAEQSVTETAVSSYGGVMLAGYVVRLASSHGALHEYSTQANKPGGLTAVNLTVNLPFRLSGFEPEREQQNWGYVGLSHRGTFFTGTSTANEPALIENPTGRWTSHPGGVAGVVRVDESAVFESRQPPARYALLGSDFEPGELEAAYEAMPTSPFLARVPWMLTTIGRFVR